MILDILYAFAERKEIGLQSAKSTESQMIALKFKFRLYSTDKSARVFQNGRVNNGAAECRRVL